MNIPDESALLVKSGLYTKSDDGAVMFTVVFVTVFLLSSIFIPITGFLLTTFMSEFLIVFPFVSRSIV